MPSIKEPDLALAGLALLVIFGLLIWYDRPVESARPFDPYIQHQDLQTTDYAYQSWLWQDPFGFDLDSYTERNQYYIDFGDNIGKTSPYRFRVYKKTDVEPIAHKKESEDKKKETDESKKTEPKEGQCEGELNKKISDIKNNDNKTTVKILAPLLKVRPDTTENKELRTRDRYAVIAGLMEAGYHPSETDRLHFCSSQKNKEYDVRWEHFRYEPQPNKDTFSKNETDQPEKDEADNKSDNKPDKKPDIVVVWMNSEIFADADRFDFISKSLLRLEEIENFYIFDLNNILDQKRTVDVNKKIACINKNNNKNIEFKRTETDDKGLADKLTEELRLRFIKPSEVMIITEQDSENVRALADNFCKSFSDSFKEKQDTNVKDSPNPKDKPDVDLKDNTCEIRNVFYLKGLDAYQQIVHNQDKNEEANKQAARLSGIDLNIPPPLPIGPSQFDYFHRLAKQINDPHKEINLETRDIGIKAVGIFGSDFYDKLLILEALRAEMPNILVFTTDLDAQMLHPPHWLSTRNLVVASHFNLLLEDGDKDEKERLKRSHQEQTSPFRDSHQGSIFFSTISTITGHVQESSLPSPQIFEIGRHGFVRLGAAQENDQAILPLMSPDIPIARLWFLAQTQLLLLSLLTMMIVSLICFHWRILPNSLESSLWLLSYPLAIFAVALFFATDKLGEPLSFTDGVSLWPSIFIQIIAIIMALAFFFRGKKELDANFDSLNNQHFGFCLLRWEEVSKWRNVLLFTGIILFFSIAIYAYNDVNPSDLQFKWCFLLLMFLAIAFFLLKLNFPYNDNTFDFNSIKDWIEKDNSRPVKNENDLWKEYYNYGRIDHRVSRVVAIWLFFAIIETILIYIVPPWPLPCRGNACDWASWIGVMSFTAVMLLLFFVLDAVRLNYYWIKKLRTQHPLLAEDYQGGFDAFGNAITNYPLQSLEKIVAVVAERTEVVDKLIYYPMLCIMLMLFARITYFDNQDFPLSKGITFAASISLLFFSGFILRYEAEKLKRLVIQSAENLGKNNTRIQPEARKVIKRIKGICEGAFEPMFEQPVLRALLIILASVGLFVGEYLKLFE
ncbi:hypothetical protein [Nitrosovibrio sp. Nv6]|uniref:hypothetical protein n=1 Tax=Nitrosovibrio sp. Nv6 TaxID=1855340 RepID=UPI0008B6572B|nr:hypothetical protein [Nitrosovibrio sp. Nv6]SEP26550.1 hypothetical protein SAMN05216316_2213 [Nitrosovibrio sp. Nv6]